jgi:hypothetical protein
LAVKNLMVGAYSGPHSIDFVLRNVAISSTVTGR